LEQKITVWLIQAINRQKPASMAKKVSKNYPFCYFPFIIRHLVIYEMKK